MSSKRCQLLKSFTASDAGCLPRLRYVSFKVWNNLQQSLDILPTVRAVMHIEKLRFMIHMIGYNLIQQKSQATNRQHRSITWCPPTVVGQAQALLQCASLFLCSSLVWYSFVGGREIKYENWSTIYLDVRFYTLCTKTFHKKQTCYFKRNWNQGRK